MGDRTYIIALDTDKYGWDHLWNHTISQISRVAVKIEIIAMVVPILAVTTNGEDIDLLHNIEGIKTIEEEAVGFIR